MLAVFKRELQSYFHSVTGYLVIAAMMLFIGIYYIFINMTYGYSSFSDTLYSVRFIFTIVIPILTMRSFSEERKNKTDQLLLTSPVSVTSIVLGKFLSMISVFGIVCVFSAIFPIILKSLGSTKAAISYAMLLAFFLLGCAAIAIGMFISSLTENQILACVGTIGVMLVFELMTSISSLIPETAKGSFVGLLVIIIIAAVLAWKMTSKKLIPLIGGAVGCALVTAIYFLKSEILESLLPHFLNSLALATHLEQIYNEMFDVTAVIYYLSIIFLFLFLTVQAIERRRWSFNAYTTFSAILSYVVIACVIIVNMVTCALPSSIIYKDLSSSQIYTLSDQTKNIVKNLEQDVTLYALFESDYEDTTLMQLLERYEELSDHIKTEVVDPVKNPAFTSNYDASSLQTGSMIIVSGDRYKTIDSSEIYETTYDYYTYTSTQDFDGEGEITSAIDYVVSENLPVLYYTTGHDELNLSDTITTTLSKSNYALQELSLLSEESVPEDCGVLMILSPASDFSSEEADMVIEYLENGGHALITAGYNAEKLTEFERILENYGMLTSDGIIFEGDADAYFQSPMYIIPEYGSHTITSEPSSSSTPALIVQTSAINSTNVRSSVSQTVLLSTSGEAYEKVPENGQFATTEKEKSDTEGTFNLGVIAEEEAANGETTQLVVFGTPYLTDDSLIGQYNISNVDLFVNSISYMCEHETSVTISAKSMDVETVTPTAASVNMQVMVFIIIIPAGLLVTGIVVWIKRRKK